MYARQSTMFLYLIAKINPQAWDAIIPHGPKVSAAARDYLMAMAVKGFSAELNNRAVTTKLAGIQKTLVAAAGSRLAAEFDDDNWCGTPWHIHFPVPVPDPQPWFNFSYAMLNPQPLPPKERQKEIGGYLVLLAAVASNQDIAKQLESIGTGLMR